MTRELKESNERMMKITIEQFAQLAMSNRDKGVFPNKPEVNPRGDYCPSFDPNGIRKVNAIISLWSGKKVDSHVVEQNDNDSPSLLSSCPPPRSDDVFPSPIIQISLKDVGRLKERESIYDSTSLKDSLTPLCVAKPSPSLSNWLKWKKVQSHTNKIRETFSQVKINIHLLDVIQQMPLMLAFLNICAQLREPLMSPKEHFWPLYELHHLKSSAC